ncbi:D-arabinono-1,4-lactone oxidase [Lentzea flaviverrucosa]|uniref:L-gulonolactone oxidase n=1 Tax=Lentzea flaviverrucosa TaxID=200379 RepID=A0A1H9BGN6_9PSEU|nr:D-arabinono-1,4-lactone oxidase [Lentzea flaviverrucosa]RDI31775.1 L-gulonolactone oxidase [Lentzea flaviverrucosa]SEP88180.1 L-gulonolactone oxidase [Lentzea flaviverrucosa]
MTDARRLTPGPEITTGGHRGTAWSNWSGAVRGVADRLLTPGTTEQLREVVLDDGARARGISVVGSGHSYANLVAPAGRTLVDLRNHRGVVAVDPTAMTVTVKAGTTMRELNWELAAAGFALPNQSAIDEQTVAGVVATATHGSSPKQGTLSSHVVSARILTADGQVRAITQDDPELDGVRVHLGCLGVVLDLTFAIVPGHRLRKVVVRRPLPDVLASLDDFREVHFGGFWWYPHTSQAIVWSAAPTDEPHTSSPGPPGALLSKLCNNSWPPRVAGAAHYAAALAASTGGVQVTRCDDALLHHLPPPVQGTEYSVPFGQAADAIRALVREVRRGGLRISAPVDVRFTAADSAWLSPSRRGITCHIGVTHPVPARGSRMWIAPLRAVDSVLWNFEGRPHWAKVHFRTGQELAARYPEWSRFQELRRAWDPDGVFLGSHLRNLFEL